MAADPLGRLFDRYRREGDLAALARVFEEAGPELLRLARFLRPRRQAPEDLVQTTFLTALSRRDAYDSSRPLRPWLLGILLNKAAAGRRPEVELEGDVPGAESPEDAAEAAEAAGLLARGLERLPPVYSEVLREHFFGGRSPRAIAARLGRPPGTVRSQLHRGLRLLRRLVPASLAGWLAWLGPARAGLLRVRRAVLEQAAGDGALVRVPAGAPPLVGARLAGAGAITLAVALGLRAWMDPPPRTAVPERADAAARAEPPSTLPPAEERESGARTEVAAIAPDLPAAAATHGELLVRVRFPDGTPAPGIGLRVYAWGEPSWSDNLTTGVTDGAGELALARIRAGRVGLYPDRGGEQGFGAIVRGGGRAVVEIALPAGVQVSGEVVDARGAPVAGAGVWLSESPLPGGGRIATVCDELGRFDLRDVSPYRFIGARAAGLAPSEIEWLASGGLRAGDTARLRLVLADAGGSIAGSVVDAAGAAVAGAEVVARTSAERRVRVRADGTLLGPSTPLEATSDARGRFELADLAPGEYELSVRAAGHPAHAGTARVTPEHPRADVELRLPAVGRVRGSVRFPGGEPAAGALVIARSGHDQADIEVDARGAFVLEGVAPGEVLLQVGFGHEGGGPLARETLWLPPGGELEREVLLERPTGFVGRILGPGGAPLAGAWLRAVPAGQREGGAALPGGRDALGAWLFEWPDRSLRRELAQVAADAEGRFALEGVPVPFAVEARLPGGRSGWPARVFDPPPVDGDLVLASEAPPSGVLSGTIAGPDGTALSRGEVYAVSRSGGEVRKPLEASGAFRFEALPEGTFDVLVWARGQPPRIVATVALAAGEQRELGWLRLGP